jgi:hypothetical protein
MGAKSSKIQHEPIWDVTPEVLESYKAAGIIFRSQTHVLAGYQANKKKPCISGLGGCREKGENYYETAWRETIEELFGIHGIPPSLLALIRKHLPATRVTHTNTYILIIYTFEDLQKLLNLIRKINLPQTMYAKYPRSLDELIHLRNPLPRHEVQGLALIPIVKHEGRCPLISTDFLKDMITILQIKGIPPT